MRRFSAAVLLVRTAGWSARAEAQGVPGGAEMTRAVTGARCGPLRGETLTRA